MTWKGKLEVAHLKFRFDVLLKEYLLVGVWDYFFDRSPIGSYGQWDKSTWFLKHHIRSIPYLCLGKGIFFSNTNFRRVFHPFHTVKSYCRLLWPGEPAASFLVVPLSVLGSAVSGLHLPQAHAWLIRDCLRQRKSAAACSLRVCFEPRAATSIAVISEVLCWVGQKVHSGFSVRSYGEEEAGLCQCLVSAMNKVKRWDAFERKDPFPYCVSWWLWVHWWIYSRIWLWNLFLHYAACLVSSKYSHSLKLSYAFNCLPF